MLLKNQQIWKIDFSDIQEQQKLVLSIWIDEPFINVKQMEGLV
jgi:hypothetical protein